MASKVLYPPIVDSYMPAFEAGVNSYCEVYFRLSKFNASSDFSSVHATVVKQSTSMNVVKKIDDNGRYRSTGIILNIKPEVVKTEDNLYYIRINSSDLSSISDGYEGWIPDWTYKIQIRLSSKDYDGSIGQAAWLNGNASYFSEWSTICIVKAIRHITYTIDVLDIDTSDENNSTSNDESIATLYSSIFPVSGEFSNCGSENIHTYSFILYDADDTIIENSGSIYANQFQDNKSYNYLMKTELEDGKTYKFEFKFETDNHFIGGAYKYTNDDGEEIDKRYEFIVSQAQIDRINCYIITAENDENGLLTDITSVHAEEEEGRIGIKLYSPSSSSYSGNICIRRADSRDNFKTWEDIKIYIAKEQIINNIPIIYDYTIESGVWYKYGVQGIDKDGTRGVMNTISPIMRNFNYSFLLGKDDKQLKLMFDNAMGSFKIQMQESKIDPIGATYPIVTRNAATRYRTFPLNGLISFWMDENEVFCNKKVVYDYEDVVELYNVYNDENNIIQYDYIYERDFRNMVLDFLHDGEFKLFKSPTEGNIIIRLTDINCTPNQSLDRMIYSFTSNAHEMAAPTMANYLKYGFYYPGEYGTDFSTFETRLGQIQMDFPVGVNIFNEIYKKYDSQGKNLGGYSKTLNNIHHIKITFDSKPLRIQNSSNEYVVGNNFLLNGKLFTVYDPVRMYEFDERLEYTALDSLVFLGDAEGKVTTVRATIDFLYEMQSEVYQGKQIQERTVKSGIGQVFNEYKPGADIYNEIYYKYYIESERTFRRLNLISSIEIEANPGTVLLIRDEADTQGENHVVGATGQLRFYELSNIGSIRYVGVQHADGTIDNTQKTDILINYYYVLTKGTYKVVA